MSDQPLPDTWHSRDLPVLREAARLLEAADLGQGAPSSSICTATGLDDTAVYRALKALEVAGLIDVRWVNPSTHARVIQISANARIIVGQWPTEEAALDRIVRALEAIAGNASDPANQEAAQALDAFQRAGHAFQSVAEAALTGEMP